jgi:hypothetical protein
MKFKQCVLLTAILIALAGLTFIFDADAQQRAPNIVRIRDLDADKVKTPIYRVSNAPQGRTREWLKIETEYDTAPDWIDELDFEYYVLVRDKEGDREYILFRGDVTYVNVERTASSASRHMSAMYLHPSTLARYGDVERMAVLIKYKGRLVGMESEPESNARWWEQLTPVRGLLLNRMETPFAMINFDNYEAIKATESR